MVLTVYAKKRIVLFEAEGYRPPKIAKMLESEGIFVSRRGVDKFLLRVKATGSITRQAGSGRPTKLTREVKKVVEEAMRNDDETTAVQLHAILVDKQHTLSLGSILRCRKSLGWTFRGSAYCQMLREANKTKRLEWATQYVHETQTGFLNVVFSDETSVQLESHRRFCCRKRGEPPKNKPRYMLKKHSYTHCPGFDCAVSCVHVSRGCVHVIIYVRACY